MKTTENIRFSFQQLLVGGFFLKFVREEEMVPLAFEVETWKE